MQRVGDLTKVFERLQAQAEERKRLAAMPLSESRYRQLASLPSTETVEKELRQELSAKGRERIATKLELCLLRDTVQGQRPEGCFCLGTGFPKHRWADGRGEWVEWCACAEGQARQLAVTAEQAAATKARDIERRTKAWAASETPRRFADYRLSSSPARGTYPALFARMEKAEPASWYLFSGRDESGRALTGRGKTGTAVAYLRELCERSPKPVSVLFRSVPDLLATIRATYSRADGPSEMDIIRKHTEVDVLLLDDLGVETAKDKEWLEDRLYQVVGKRHDEEMPTIFTSNLSIQEIASKIGERLAWRIVEMCGPANIVELRGPNLRDVLRDPTQQERSR